MKYLDENIDETILTLNYIFAFPIKKNVICDFHICHKIYRERYSLYKKYMLLNLLFCEDITNLLITNIIKIT